MSLSTFESRSLVTESRARRRSDVPTLDLSPSPNENLPSYQRRSAFEIKFLVTEDEARAVRDRMRGAMVVDPHADTTRGNTYRVTTMYFDTPEFDVFHRAEDYRRRKHRVRRYGEEERLYLERKAKRGDRVRKRREMIARADLAELTPRTARKTWSGWWFHERLLRDRLAPVCRMRYDREAYLGDGPAGAMRLTFDRGVRGVMTPEWAFEDVGDEIPTLSNRVILEFKFAASMPAIFKETIEEFGLAPAKISKYRMLVQTSRGEIPGAIDHAPLA